MSAGHPTGAGVRQNDCQVIPGELVRLQLDACLAVQGTEEGWLEEEIEIYREGLNVHLWRACILGECASWESVHFGKVCILGERVS